jgi:hypothetical protein
MSTSSFKPKPSSSSASAGSAPSIAFPAATFGAPRALSAASAPPLFLYRLGESAPAAPAAAVATSASSYTPSEDLAGRLSAEVMPPPRPRTPGSGTRAFSLVGAAAGGGCGSGGGGGGGGGGEEEGGVPTPEPAPASDAPVSDAPVSDGPAPDAPAPDTLPTSAPPTPAPAAPPPLAAPARERAAAVDSEGAALTAHEAKHHELLQRAAAQAEEALRAEVAVARGVARWLKGEISQSIASADCELERLMDAAETFLENAQETAQTAFGDGDGEEGGSGGALAAQTMSE